MTWLTGTTSALASTPLALSLLVAPVPVPPPGGAGTGAAPSGPSGSAFAPDGVLRRGCRDYPYRYSIGTPTDDWTLEVFLRDRDGRNLASGTFISDHDPRARSARFRFCRFSTRAGWFTIRSLVHWYDSDGTGHRAWLDQTRFRLRRPR